MRTNSLIVTDHPENIQAIESMIAVLDKPEPQVEIEARIVIANRSFLRDIGSELGAAGVNTHNGATGFLQTSPLRLNNGRISPGGEQSSGGSGGGTGGSGNQDQNSLGQNLVGPFATNALRATANTVLSLTTGALGTSILSWALTASERKGQIRTIASPRITAQDNQTAEIVNGIQIPIQTVSNNTITTTFVTAALRLEITPQIIEETGEVMMHVVAENNSVNTAIAQALNSDIPGIDTQSAESVVRVSDGGTTVMGGITIDRESYFQNRTPGIARLPLVGNLFKRRNTERNSDEILFFITPRIVRADGTLGPANVNPQRSEGQPAAINPAGPKVAASPAVPPSTGAAGAKVGQSKK
jgi:type IV pilus assembly protein PilQ